ncbi:MAG: MMPL family transporter, partial [Deltaproteobacteria bacterium]|nr:MMPL family transporter [Deltaproteobacteria bacterium]
LGIAWGVYGMTQTRFEYDNSVLRPDRGGNEIQYRANNMLGGSFTPTQFIAADRDHLRAGLDAIERHRKALGKASTVGGTMSILDLVPRRQHEKEKILGRLEKILARRTWRHVSPEKKQQIHFDELRRAAKAKPFDVADLPTSIRRSFHGPGFGDRWIGLATYHINISDTREARRFKDEVGAVKGSPFVDLGTILQKRVRSWVDGPRVEIAAGRDRPKIVRKLRGLTHGDKKVFVKVLTADAAVATGIAVEGGLRGDLLAIAAPGFIPRAAGVPGAPSVVPSGVFKVTSSEIVLTDVVEVMLHDSKIAFVLSISAVFLACLLDFRKLRLAVLASSPLVMGLLWTFGVLHLFSMKLNMFNFIMLPVLVGIGIDYGVHFVHRYESDGPDKLDWVGRQLRWVLLFCSATTIVGFGNMSLATHPGLRSLGTLAVIGLVSMFLASTVALPALLATLGKKKP